MESHKNDSSTIADKLNNLKFTCKTHNSEIGGVCDSFDCNNKIHLLCVKCVSDANSCIRQKKHSLIPFSEFVNKFFVTELDGLKKDFNLSSSVSNVEYYIKNSSQILTEFSQKMKNINAQINLIFKTIMDEINAMFDDFNSHFAEIMDNKQTLLKESLENLNDLVSFDGLAGLQMKELKEKLARMPIDNFNSSIHSMKKMIKSLNKREHVKFEEVISHLINLNEEEVVKTYKTSFEEIEASMIQTHNILKHSLNENLFKQAKTEKKPLGDLKLNQEFKIDYSINSNFLDKKFTIFEHSNGKTLLAYPTSQNTIKLEYFEKFYKENDLMATSNKTLNSTLNLNIRDPFLYFKLGSHGGRINDLAYYRYTSEESSSRDFLITSSDDKSIKIWDITHLHKYLDNVNDYYKSNCVKTLLGHENRISCFTLFYDPINSLPCLISVGYGDRIKVWNVLTGKLMRNFNEITNYDTLVTCFTKDKTNYALTSGNNFSFRIWDFETGKVLQVVKYPKHKIVSILEYRLNNDNDKNFLIIDDTGKSFLLCTNNITDYELISLNLEAHKTERISAITNENSLLVFCKNGVIYEYDLIEKTFKSDLRVSSVSISHILFFHHHTHKDLLFVHSLDQQLRIFS